MSKPPQDTPPIPLAEFLNTVPSPLVTILVGLRPYASHIRHGLEIVTWKSRWEESWLTLASWWAVCLLSEVALRYVLPIAILSVLFVSRWSSRPRVSPPPITEENLQQSIADLTAVHTLLSSLTSSKGSWNTPDLTILIRVLAILYVPYLALTYFVRLRVIIALIGTILLTWKARWSQTIRRGFWRSAWIRWTAYRAWSYLSGQPLPARIVSPQTVKNAQIHTMASTQEVNTIRFLFTVYENQRWWMGLDWTAALLPGERPSWCSTSQQPVAPPSVFSLPAPTTVFVREGSKRLKRTARWTWEEDEWRVILHKEGTTPSRVERPLPMDEPGAPTGANRLMKVAGKMRQASLSGPSSDGHERADSDEGGKSVEKASKDNGYDDDVFTDGDGWVFGDNKWENCSGKGGMGKYTRYRRWTRIAVLSETVETVDDGEVGIRRDDGSPVRRYSYSQAKSPSHSKSMSQSSATIEVTPTYDTAPLVSSPSEERSKLRQRLQAAMKGSSMHT